MKTATRSLPTVLAVILLLSGCGPASDGPAALVNTT
jgi:hypothetical protein